MPKPKQTEGRTELEVTADAATEIACKQLDAGLLFRQPLMQRIREKEDCYAMKERPALAGRFSIPFDGIVMRGYVDTLMSKIDESNDIEFKNDIKESAFKAAKKHTAAWKVESSPERANWQQKNRWAKKQMILADRAYFLCYGDSDPFSFNIENVDHYDMVFEPNGGGNLNKHLFTYQMNVFRTKKDLKDGVTAGRYNKAQVEKLINSTSRKDTKENEDAYRNKESRFASLGLSAESNNYVGSQLFNLTQGHLWYEGEHYWIVFDRKSRIWVRFEPFKTVYKSGLIPWVSFSSNDDAFSFLGLAPADPILALADAEYITLNGMLNNFRKRLDEMVVYDPNIIADPSQLVYRPDGLIAATLKGADIRSAIMQLKPEDSTQLALNIHTFLDKFIGENSGITPGAKGASDDDKVGIYFGNMQQVAERIGKYNKSYTAALEEIGHRFEWALHEHSDGNYAVKIIGTNGAEWDETITKEDTDFDFNVQAVGSRAEQQVSELKAKKQFEGVKLIAENPNLVGQVNSKELSREILRLSDFDEGRITALMNTSSDSDQEMLAEASRLIEDTLAGKPIKLYRGADTTFVQKILDFAADNAEKESDYLKLMMLADKHMPIAIENMTRRAMMKKSIAQSDAPMNGPQPQIPGAPQPSAPFIPPAPTSSPVAGTEMNPSMPNA